MFLCFNGYIGSLLQAWECFMLSVLFVYFYIQNVMNKTILASRKIKSRKLISKLLWAASRNHWRRKSLTEVMMKLLYAFLTQYVVNLVKHDLTLLRFPVWIREYLTCWTSTFVFYLFQYEEICSDYFDMKSVVS